MESGKELPRARGLARRMPKFSREYSVCRASSLIAVKKTAGHALIYVSLEQLGLKQEHQRSASTSIMENASDASSARKLVQPMP
jgi:hypothetical protein